jgi:hypothetical protein
MWQIALGFVIGLAVGSWTGDRHCRNLELRLAQRP